MPTEMRTSPSVMPICWRVAGGTDACAIIAGCEISVSTSLQEFLELVT